MSKKSAQQQLDDVVKLYLEKNKTTTSENIELEVRFGTKGPYRISHTNYDNIVKKLLSLGFTSSNPEYLLRINNVIIERIQDLLLRVSIGLHDNDLDS